MLRLARSLASSLAVCEVARCLKSGVGVLRLLHQERRDTQALRRNTNEEMDKIMKQLSDITYNNEQEDGYVQ